MTMREDSLRRRAALLVKKEMEMGGVGRREAVRVVEADGRPFFASGAS